MKLLSLRLCEHDSNISYYDGNSVRYFKSERSYSVKHHAYNNLWQWRDDIKRLWGVDYNDIDEIAIVIDPWLHKLPYVDNEEIFPAVEYDFFPAKCKVWRLNHHYAHSLSGWMLPKSSTQIVIDGFGELNNAWTVFKNDKIEKIGKITKNGSIGLIMFHLGKDIGIESEHAVDVAGKLMALQSYGNYDSNFAENIKHLDFYNMDAVYDFNNYIKYKGDNLVANLNVINWLRTVHELTGDILVEFFKQFCDSNEHVFYSGGVAQNVLWNTKLKKNFPNLIIAPHSADEGLSLGGIEWLRRKNNLAEFNTLKDFPFIQQDERPVNKVTEETINRVANLLAAGKVVAWYQNNGEIGPRALGNRSILMDPRTKGGKNIINTIKRRENYRPFGASVLSEDKQLYFKDLPDNPYMLYVGDVIINELECITHVDGTCRAQTVDASNVDFYKLLTAFKEITGCSVLLNTSLNIAGKPIAGNTNEAVSLFSSEPIDCLVIGNIIMEK